MVCNGILKNKMANRYRTMMPELQYLLFQSNYFSIKLTVDGGFRWGIFTTTTTTTFVIVPTSSPPPHHKQVEAGLKKHTHTYTKSTSLYK
jgi:hypothetical protein